jgi:hypothetical protein
LGAENITKNAQKQQKIEKNCLKPKKTPIYTQISLKIQLATGGSHNLLRNCAIL